MSTSKPIGEMSPWEFYKLTCDHITAMFKLPSLGIKGLAEVGDRCREPAYSEGVRDALEILDAFIVKGLTASQDEAYQRWLALKQGHDMMASAQLEDKERN